VSWSAVQNAILARFDAVCPVPLARRALDSFNAPKFDPPAIDTAAPANSIWIRPTINPYPGTSRAFGLAQNANNWREGRIVLQVFYPAGLGEGAYLDPVVDAAVLVFHRQYLGASVRCKDSEDPLRITETEDPEWAQINVVTPYVVIEVL
jgi:hypothetical protein